MELPNYKEDLIVALQSGVSDDQAEQIAEMLYAPRTAAGHCRGCRWWAGTGEDEGDCTLLSTWGNDTTPLAYTFPSAGAEGATFVCSPDFGCVQFEAKP